MKLALVKLSKHYLNNNAGEVVGVSHDKVEHLPAHIVFRFMMLMSQCHVGLHTKPVGGPQGRCSGTP